MTTTIILVVMAVVTLAAIASAVLNQHLIEKVETCESLIDELRYAIDTDSIAIVDAAEEAKIYKSKYERQLEINNRLMERIKLHEY